MFTSVTVVTSSSAALARSPKATKGNEAKSHYTLPHEGRHRLILSNQRIACFIAIRTVSELSAPPGADDDLEDYDLEDYDLENYGLESAKAATSVINRSKRNIAPPIA